MTRWQTTRCCRPYDAHHPWCRPPCAIGTITAAIIIYRNWDILFFIIDTVGHQANKWWQSYIITICSDASAHTTSTMQSFLSVHHMRAFCPLLLLLSLLWFWKVPKWSVLLALRHAVRTRKKSENEKTKIIRENNLFSDAYTIINIQRIFHHCHNQSVFLHFTEAFLIVQ